MPSRTIKARHRPRVTDRTLHCRFLSGQSSALLFPETMGAVTTASWNHGGEESFALLPTRRGTRPFGLREALSERGCLFR